MKATREDVAAIRVLLITLAVRQVETPRCSLYVKILRRKNLQIELSLFESPRLALRLAAGSGRRLYKKCPRRRISR